MNETARNYLERIKYDYTSKEYFIKTCLGSHDKDVEHVKKLLTEYSGITEFREDVYIQDSDFSALEYTISITFAIITQFTDPITYNKLVKAFNALNTEDKYYNFHGEYGRLRITYISN